VSQAATLILCAIALAAGSLYYRARLRRLIKEKDDLEYQISERNAALEIANTLLAKLAQEDGLTGLLNRRAFDMKLQEECRRSSRNRTSLALILIDLDAFKAYNDQLGHPAGDECLRIVSQTISDASRRAGEIAARYGGEELAVIIPGHSTDNVMRQAEHLRARIQDLGLPNPGSQVARVVTVSIGVAFAPLNGDVNPAAMVAAADRALYLAKQRGRNRVEVDGARQP
jgi:diguanylate cyclase (GGDEF)-like protein